MTCKHVFNFLGIIALSLLFLSCASIISGSNELISFKTDPSDASIKIYNHEGKMVKDAKSPCKVKLKRGNGYFSGAEYNIEITKIGYGKKEFMISSSVNGWYILGNFFIGGLIGWLIIDPLTGAMWSLEPSNINTTLDKQISSNDGEILIILRQNVTDNMMGKAKFIGKIE